MERTENDPITRRLHSLGSQPIDPEVAAAHRNLMASVPVAPSRSRLRPLMAGSLLAGSLLGGMGLAAAAPSVILPSSASDAAQKALNKVTLGVVADPDDTDDKNDDKNRVKRDDKAEDAAETATKPARAANDPAGTHGVTRSTAGCPSGFTGNHGQYVSSVAKSGATEAETTAAAQSDCGKPIQSVKPEAGARNTNEGPDRSGKEQGKPDAGVEKARPRTDRPDNPANEKAERVGKNSEGDARNSAGRVPRIRTP